MTYDTLLEAVETLSIAEKWRLATYLLHELERSALSAAPDATLPPSTEDAWQRALSATYGILADDPIERPPQLPVEDREPLE